VNASLVEAATMMALVAPAPAADGAPAAAPKKFGGLARFKKAATTVKIINRFRDFGSRLTKDFGDGEITEASAAAAIKRQRRHGSVEMVPGRLQHEGDITLMSADAIAQRVKLRDDPDINVVLDAFWDFAGKRYDFEDGQMDHARYQVFHRSIVVASNGINGIESFINPGQEQHYLKLDWERDSGGTDFMKKEGFCDSMFELVDCWAHDLEAMSDPQAVPDDALLLRGRPEGDL
jgi:hypothetical protein